jgi:hypothetical protein
LGDSVGVPAKHKGERDAECDGKVRILKGYNFSRTVRNTFCLQNNNLIEKSFPIRISRDQTHLWRVFLTVLEVAARMQKRSDGSLAEMGKR